MCTARRVQFTGEMERLASLQMELDRRMHTLTEVPTCDERSLMRL